jgi:CubicO group peptidase (beta-lactamase class C family)
VARSGVLALAAVLVVGCARLASTPAVTAPASATELQVVEPAGPTETFTDPQRRAKLETAFPALDTLLEARKTSAGLPSLVFGIVVDGELVYRKALGTTALGGATPVGPDTLYRIGSITKTFTGLAVLKLRDEGRLSLDDPATKTLPELAALRYPTRDSPPITLRHLLTHASGLPPLGAFAFAQSDHDVTEAEMLNDLSHVALVAVPGTRELYSNFGFGLVGLVIRRVTGQRYRDYVDAALLRPLGMLDSRWTPDGVPRERLATPYQISPTGPREVAPWRLGEFEAAGGLWASLRDMARYVAFQLSAYPPRDEADRGPVRRSSVRESHAVQRTDDLSVTWRDAAKDGHPLVEASAPGVGIAWLSRQTCDFEQIVGHLGGTEGHTAFVRLLPRRGVGFIALANLQNADLIAITTEAMELVNRTGGLLPRQLAPGPALTRAVSRSVGLYNDFREAEYLDLFAPAFRAAIAPGRVIELVAQLKSFHGACRAEPLMPLSVESPGSGVFAVACEHGWLEWHVVTGDGGKVTESTVKPHQDPLAALPSQGRCKSAADP